MPTQHSAAARPRWLGSRAYGLDEELAKTLVHTLEPVVGADHVRASVHVEYELGTSEDTQETYDPKTTATLTQEHSEESSAGARSGWSAGYGQQRARRHSASGGDARAPNNPLPNRIRRTFAVSKSLHRSVEPPGRVHRIAAAVVVDDAVEITEQAGKRSTTRRKRTPEEMKQIEQLAEAAIGVNPQRGDVLAVENLSFQQPPAEILASPPARSSTFGG